MQTLIAFFIRRHLLVNMIVVVTLAIGIFVVGKTQRESFPATPLNLVAVRTYFLGASAEEIESLISKKIERAVRGVDGVDTITSVSGDSLSSVTVELDQSLSDDEVRDAVEDIEDAVAGISDLPKDIDSAPKVVLFNPSRIPAADVFISGPIDVVRSTSNRVKELLEGVYGVSEVIRVGLGSPQVLVSVDPDRAADHGVSLDEIMLAIRQRNARGTAGKIESLPFAEQVIVDGGEPSVHDIRTTVIRRDPRGGLIRVADVAQVGLVPEDTGLIVHGDGKRGVSLVVRKRESADIMRCVDDLRATLDAFEKPPGVEIGIYADSSRMARNRLGLVAENGLFGIGLVVLVLIFFLTRKIAFWVGFGIPFTVLGVATLLPLADVTVNMVSMAAFVLVIGLIVDDAIVVAERIAHFRERGLPPTEAGIKGASEMSMPVIAAMSTTVMAFSPMLAIGGLPGRFAWAIPTVVVLSLAVSVFECFFLLPAHVSSDGPGAKKDTKPAWLIRLEELYKRVLLRVLGHRFLLLTGFFVLFVVTMAFAATKMPVVLFPQGDAFMLEVTLKTPIGTPLAQTEAAVFEVERQIAQVVGDDLGAVTSRIGHAIPSMARQRGGAGNEAMIRAELTNERRFGAPAWAQVLRRSLKAPPGSRISVSFQQIGPPVGKPITVHVAAHDDEVRRKVVRDLLAALRDNPASVDESADDEPGLPQILLRPDYEAIAMRRVDLDTVLRTVKAALFGLPITELSGDDESIAVRVRYALDARRHLDTLLDTPIRAQDGQLLPLRQLVVVKRQASTAAILRRGGMRSTQVSAMLDGQSTETASTMAAWLKRDIFPNLLAEHDVKLAIGGEAEQSAETLGDMPFVAGMALVGMLMIVTLLFNSWLQALFIVSAVPLGYIGVVWTFWFHDVPLSFFAMMGAIGLSGVVVNDSIVMVSRLSQERERKAAQIVDAAAERLRPVLLTSLTTVVGVMPTAYGFGGKDVLLSPMSLALGWGLVFASGIILFLVPSLFLVRSDIERWIRKRPQATSPPIDVVEDGER